MFVRGEEVVRVQNVESIDKINQIRVWGGVEYHFLGLVPKGKRKCPSKKLMLRNYLVKNIPGEETMALPLGGQIFFECPKDLIFHKNWWTMPEFGIFCEVIFTPK